MIAEEGKAGRNPSERWAAILVSSPAASNKQSRPVSCIHAAALMPRVLVRARTGVQNPLFKLRPSALPNAPNSKWLTAP